MKKLLGILLAAAVAACTAVSASAAGTGTTLGKIKSVITNVAPDDIFQGEISVLNKSVSVTKSLTVADGEFLVIPGGKSLSLKKGAEIDGDIYVAEGGKLTFGGGDVTINGSIVSDGTVTLKADANILVFGEIYVSGKGTLSVGSDEKLGVGESGEIVCLGKTNSKLLDIATNPIAAVFKRTDLAGKSTKTEVVTDNFDSVIPDPDKYYTQSEIPAGGTSSTLYLFFDNGACVSANKISGNADSENYTGICGIYVRYALIAIDMAED
ncbi:MAG: hypothetical protein K2O14_10945 [Oscillospiraceae bacterium]|nr:hypothetical protein [Oscillospiraceae bacterium]